MSSAAGGTSTTGTTGPVGGTGRVGVPRPGGVARAAGGTARRAGRSTPAGRGTGPVGGTDDTAPPAGETPLARKRRARRMARELATVHPDAHCELDFDGPLQLTVATVLSAQTTDVRVNQVTPELFRRYRTAADYAAADRAELEELLRPIGFYRNKADALIRLGQALVERYDGRVPDRMADLLTLPWVGRKTANVILGNAFGVPGLTVDTHFARLVRRWGWTVETDPERIEHAVAELIEPREWTMLSHRVIFHGRRVCHARRPACGACPLARWCPSHGAGPTDRSDAVALLKGPRVAELAAMVPEG